MHRLLHVFLIIIISCQLQNQPSKLPKSYGQFHQLLIVIDSTSWKSDLGNTIKKYLTSDFLVLPQSEPIFDLKQKTKETFHGELNKFRNIIFIAALNEKNNTARYINKIIKAKNVERSDFYYFSVKDPWAKPQLVTYIYAPTTKELLTGLNEQIQDIIQRLKEFDYLCIQNALYRSKENTKLKTLLNDKFNIHLFIPYDFKLAINDSAFAWIKKETRAASLNIIVHCTPFDDNKQFHIDKIIQRRNILGEKYIPGEIKGSYMITDTIIPVIHKEINFNELYAIEARGLWRLKNDFMGGAFINYSIFDKKFNRIVTLEGFIYAPGKKKRNMIMKLDAILKSLSINPSN